MESYYTKDEISVNIYASILTLQKGNFKLKYPYYDTVEECITDFRIKHREHTIVKNCFEMLKR